MMANDVDVLVIGRNCLDRVAVVDRFPLEDEKVPMIRRFTEGGGQGGTSACCISRLGGRGALVGILGDDAAGLYCRQRLKAFGADTGHLIMIPGGTTPLAYIFITAASGKRTIIYEPGTLPRIELSKDMERLVTRARVVLLAPDATHLAPSIKKRGRFKLVYDCERWRDGVEHLMASADYFIPPAAFLKDPVLKLKADSLIDCIHELDARLEGTLVVTDGERGAYFCFQKALFHVAAPQVTVKDTLGAGDNFHGAFALATARGMPLPEATKLAVATASLSCTAYGGRNGLPNMFTAREMANRITVTSVA